MRKKLKSLKVVERNVRNKGRPIFGRAIYEDGHAVIKINPKKNRNERERLDTLVHEALHIADWVSRDGKELCEREVEDIATKIVDVLWRQGYRRVNQ